MFVKNEILFKQIKSNQIKSNIMSAINYLTNDSDEQFYVCCVQLKSYTIQLINTLLENIKQMTNDFRVLRATMTRIEFNQTSNINPISILEFNQLKALYKDTLNYFNSYLSNYNSNSTRCITFVEKIIEIEKNKPESKMEVMNPQIDYFNKIRRYCLDQGDNIIQFSQQIYVQEIIFQTYFNKTETNDKHQPEFTVCDNENEIKNECPICLEEEIHKSKMCTLQCEHTFCLQCLHQILKTDTSQKKYYRCSLCRENIISVKTYK